MPTNERSTDLGAAIRTQQAENQARADAAKAPARQQHVDGLEADAKLYGTAAWDALPPARRNQVANHAYHQARQPQEGAAQ